MRLVAAAVRTYATIEHRDEAAFGATPMALGDYGAISEEF
jgi:hypothetical protein